MQYVEVLHDTRSHQTHRGFFGTLAAFAPIGIGTIRRGHLTRDVRFCLRLLVVNPKYDMRTIGFETIKELKFFGLQNAVR